MVRSGIRIGSVIVLAACLASACAAAPAQVRVVASINDLASIAAYVGGEHVQTLAIARPDADVHRVEVLPSSMVRVSRAQLYLKVGLGLDAWADAIIDGSRNSGLQVLDCSEGIEVLEKPSGKVDASLGDVHPGGNPHYWLDPGNGAHLARLVAEALGQLVPGSAEAFRARAAEFSAEAEALTAEGRRRIAERGVGRILTYHSSWPYFAQAFGLSVAGTLEPYPGIPPSARHLQGLVELTRGQGVAAVLQEPYFSDEASEFLARETGVRVLRVSPSCATAEAGSYFDHLRELVNLLALPEGR